MPSETKIIRVRYWAAARAAAGADSDELVVEGALSLAEVREQAISRHQNTRLAEVLAVCSALVGDRPAGRADPAEVRVEPGETVEFLPPFAGG